MGAEPGDHSGNRGMKQCDEKVETSIAASGSKNGQNLMLALLQRKEAKIMLKNVEG